MSEIFTDELRETFMRAAMEAKKRKHECITLEHLLYALTFDATACDIFLHSGVNIKRLGIRLKNFIDTDLHHLTLKLRDKEDYDPMYSQGFQTVLQLAVAHKRNSQVSGNDNIISEKDKKVSGANILASMFREKDSHAVYFLQEEGLKRLDVVRYISHGISKFEVEKEKEYINNIEVGTDAKTKNKDPLSIFCENVNQKVKENRTDNLIGRKLEIDRMIHILVRRRKNNPIMVGEAGVGKTAIVEGLASKIVKGEVPYSLLNKVIYSLDLGSLIAGTRYRGDFEERLKGILEIVKKNKNIVLFIDEIHSIISAGAINGGALDASNLIKPALANGELACIGTTTYKEYRSIFEKDHALSRRFQKIDVNEPPIEDAISILEGVKKHYSDFHKVIYTQEAIKGAVELSAKYINDRRLPDKAIDIIDEVGAKVRISAEKEFFEKNKKIKIVSDAKISTTKKKLNTKKVINLKTNSKVETKQEILESTNDFISFIESNPPKVNLSDIEALVAQIARIPSAANNTQNHKQLQNLNADLKKVIYGQDEAIDKLVQSIQLGRAGLGDPSKPLGAFLFAGPTGVGKTELSKQLANLLGINFLRFDMSEYMEKHTVSRLIGSPPGYVGYDEGGQLTEGIHKNPHSVLLLDEIEKAHIDLYNILLQVMDYATLTDNNGRKADFRNVVLIMTTNVGAVESQQNAIGFASEFNKDRSLKSVEKAFSPEFRNRLSSIIQFNHLEIKQVEQIVDRFVLELAKRLEAKKISLILSPEARTYLSNKGFDRRFGARPIQRLIETEIASKLSSEILFGKLSDSANGGGKVKIKLKNDNLHFEFN